MALFPVGQNIQASMNRPFAVTASAVVAMIGSVFALLVAVMMAIIPFMDLPQSQTPTPASATITGAVFIAAFGVLGIVTSIGLFRLRPWARTSILVFAGSTAITCLLVLAVVSLAPLPLPPETDPTVARGVRPLLVAMFAIPLGVSIWWLIQFNAPSTKAAFLSETTETTLARPLSITVLAWLSIIGGASCLLPIAMRMPAFVAGLTFTGWAAGITYALFGAVSLYIGRGLLDLRERARIAAIGWFLFGLVHATVMTLVPSMRARMLAAQRSMAPNPGESPPFNGAAFTTATLVVAALFAVAAIWFLVRHRSAFKAGSAQPD
jgi:hypothetical protein